MQIEVERITGAVAQVCGRPSSNIHVIYEAEGKGAWLSAERSLNKPNPTPAVSSVLT